MGLLTFSLHLRKKLIGSLPYEIAEPMMGSQWKTSGGSDLFLGLTYTRKSSEMFGLSNMLNCLLAAILRVAGL